MLSFFFKISSSAASSTKSVTPLSDIPHSLGTKLAILAELDKGRTDQFVAKLFSVTKKVVRSIRMCSEEIRSQAMGQNLLIAEDRHQEKVEEFINGWILTNVPADKHVSATFVRQMAQNMYKSMAKMAGDDPNKFRASKVWLSQFVEKYGLSHLTWIEESTPTSTNLPFVAETGNKEAIKGAYVAKGATVLANIRSPLIEEGGDAAVNVSVNESMICERAKQIHWDGARDLKKTAWQWAGIG
ncbi:hypothetical protein Bpfe_005179 [Biomphalaria pfeifferi]|uniref:HTH CENPB-type domain-containing protein n=1 Tax=Biomphalaria pfeifferi TaxID=112525 RepID=A0AAD8C3R9_BIOPF|nr:hypothetical protein Bpfe_005179 [Biomphalaria pfeifferi]